MLVKSSFTGKSWSLAPQNEKLALQISQQLDQPEIIGRLLSQRVDALDRASRYLNPKIKHWLPDPSHLLDLDQAVERLVAAIASKERIGLIGDYDVDGATSTCLMARYLHHLGCQTIARIPDRIRDGYGANQNLISELAKSGCKLVLCLDNGTTAFEALTWALQNHVEIIVIDHHAAEKDLPPALAIINPNRSDQTSPLVHLAAVGVTFILLVALNRALRKHGSFCDREEPNLLQWLDLVALGTVCDVVELSGLNRAFVAQGLRVAAKNDNPALHSLRELVRLERIDDTYHMGFLIGPRINAGGRMGQSDLGFQLLMADDLSSARSIAAKLDHLNQERRAVEKQHLNEAVEQLQEADRAETSVLVVASENWHQGVIGIVASRLVERYHRPCFVIALKDGIGKGSGRSVPGIDLGSLVQNAKQRGLLTHAGGHKMAAGLTIEQEHLPAFGEFLATHVSLTDEATVPTKPILNVSGELSPQAINLPLIDKLEKLMPFGQGNAEPVFVIRQAQIVSPTPVGDGHLRFRVASPCGFQTQAIAFRARETGLAAKITEATKPLMLAAKLRRNRYKGRESANLHVIDAAQQSD